jgi:hypothetical protein
VVLFTLVALGIASGALPSRFRLVAMLLALSSAAAIYFAAAIRLVRRRAFRLRQGAVPWGVRLRTPVWISAYQMTVPLAIGGLIGAMIAAIGFGGVGIGATLTFAVFAVAMPFMQFGMSPGGLAFEHSGLRVYIRGGSFLVPWDGIVGVEQVGPDHTQSIQLRLNDSDAVRASIMPATDAMRARVDTFVRKGGVLAGEVLFTPWTGGLDGPTLAREIRAARDGKGDRAN